MNACDTEPRMNRIVGLSALSPKPRYGATRRFVYRPSIRKQLTSIIAVVGGSYRDGQR
jgi:hypothetical protein